MTRQNRIHHSIVTEVNTEMFLLKSINSNKYTMTYLFRTKSFQKNGLTKCKMNKIRKSNQNLRAKKAFFLSLLLLFQCVIPAEWKGMDTDKKQQKNKKKL